MEKLKFILFSVVVLALVGLLLYWSVNTLQSGSEHKTAQKLEQLQNENKDLKNEVDKLQNELSFLQPVVKDETPAEQPVVEEKPAVPTKKPATPATYKNQSLINELQKLVSDNVFLKLKSQGTRVSTVQKFLNIYNKTSNKVDNDYGASTKTAVAAFQKDQGLPSDGQAGKTTFTKMIDWLKKQG